MEAPVNQVQVQEAEIAEPDFIALDEKEAEITEPNFVALEKEAEIVEPDFIALDVKEDEIAEPNFVALEKEAENATSDLALPENETENAEDKVMATEKDVEDAESDVIEAEKEVDCLEAESVRIETMEIDKDCDNGEEQNPLQTTEQEEAEVMQDDVEQASDAMDVDAINEIDAALTEEQSEATNAVEENNRSDNIDSDSDVQILNLNDEEGDANAQLPKRSSADGINRNHIAASHLIALDNICDPTVQVCAYCKMVISSI